MDDQSLRQAVSFITSNVCTTTVAWGTVPLKLLGRKAVIANNVRLASISRMFGLYRAHYAGKASVSWGTFAKIATTIAPRQLTVRAIS